VSAPDKVRIGGFEIPVVSNEEAEEVDFVVCSRVGPSPFSDNLESTCSFCGAAIMHRPYIPKKPPKICLECAVERMEGGLN
jgi:hypothetical protein